MSATKPEPLCMCPTRPAIRRIGSVECCFRCHRPIAVIDVYGLEPDAVAVLEVIVQRMRFGQATYGPLDLATNPRNWRAEANEEFLDAAVYLAMKTVKDEREQQLSQTEHRIFRAFCTPRELEWLAKDLPHLQRRLREFEALGDHAQARRLSLEILKGKRDLIETVQKRQDGDA
jgi:hypothetical protein